MSRHRLCIRLAIAPLLLLWLGGAALASDYRIGRGDTVEITVLGYPDLTRKVLVNTAGEVMLPFVGTIAVAGKTVDEIRETLKKVLGEKGVVRGAEVLVAIADYAPVYVNGDVAKPGSYGFRPGMTVRHAVALASGYGMRPDGQTPVDIWGQHRAAVLAALKAQARVIRLEAELADEEKVDFSRLTAAPTDQNFVARIVELEVEQFNTRKQNRRRELGYLKEMGALARRQKEELEAQQDSEKATIKTLSADYDRVKNAFNRRVLPAARLAEALQALAQVKARAAANASQIVEARRQQADFERRAQRFSDNERIKILGELQEAVVDNETSRARLRVAREKLSRAGGRGQFGNYADVEIRIFRQSSTGIVADEGTTLQSGDIVEIRIPYDEAPSARRPTGRAQTAE